MALVDNKTSQSISDLSLWFKVYTGDVLNLSDIPEIIPMRWVYFRDNWQLLRQRLIYISDKAPNPDYLRATIDDLTEFIARQKNNSTDVNPFSSSSIYYRFYAIFNSLPLESITLTNEERTIIDNKKRTISTFSKVDFLNIKKVLREYRDYLADLVGLSDSDYNAVYERAPVVAQAPVSLSDLSLMQVIEKDLQSVDFILANLFAVDNALDPFALARQNANNPDIDIRQYGSGRLVKLNYMEDLPSLSKRYFGTPDRWLDIAIANGLKEPYVDEVGQQLFFLSNGSGNQINIAPADPQGKENINKFYINQSILIQSDTYPYPTQRTITGIKQVPVSGEIILVVSGDTNMSLYTLPDHASIRVFKPNTINSSQYILIPSPDPVPGGRVEEYPWFMSGAGNDEKITKIDIAVGESGQLLKAASGDIALSYGIDNAIQAIRAKVQTELGANKRHPKYGLVNVVGVSTVQPDDVKGLLINSIVNQVQADQRFDRVQSISVERNTTSTAVSYNVELVVKLAGSNTVVPITFTVNS